MKLPRNFWDWWSTSAEGERAMAEATQAEVAERQAVAQRLAAVREELERALPAPLKAVDSVCKKVAEAQQALLDAELGQRQAQLVSCSGHQIQLYARQILQHHKCARVSLHLHRAIL